jgi:hypothetical protein
MLTKTQNARGVTLYRPEKAGSLTMKEHHYETHLTSAVARRPVARRGALALVAVLYGLAFGRAERDTAESWEVLPDD